MFPSLEVTSAFLFVSVVLAITPGPDNLFVLNISASRGVRFGVYVVFGLATGVLIHTTAIALGLGAVIAASPTALGVLKVVGVLYLLYLAWVAFRSSGTTDLDSEGKPLAENKVSSYYMRGIIMNVFNPKILLFFLALFPQFVEQTASNLVLQIIVLGILFATITIVVFSAIAMAAEAVRRWLLKYPSGPMTLDRASGCVFILLAANLVIF